QINNDELIIETLRKCNCYDIYEKLGDLDVPLGRNIENGQELSGGQWQKLAIARALFSDSNLLIFDEPTSAIDPKTEVEIMNNIFCLCENKTAIFISHRLGWAKNANRIIVIDNGRVIEQGTHTELINKLGAYYKMYSLQASWYRE
ncbi:ATP-binding cassette domain-containing protein, partial [Paenibacillus sp. P3E]